MRCNIGVPPEKLTDQHLIAEYRELPMVYGQLRYHGFQIKTEIPKVFSLGRGHITFFKNKFVYLQKRFYLLKSEMISRGFVPTMEFPDISNLDPNLCNDWEPTPEANKIIRKRILEKIQMKPDWYRYRSVKITESKDFDMEYFQIW